MRIRPEQPADIPGIRAVNLAAFGTRAEADLVDALRDQTTPLVSLVAEDAGAIVGHILFSPVTLDAHPEIQLMGLARDLPLRERSAGRRQAADRGSPVRLLLHHRGLRHEVTGVWSGTWEGGDVKSVESAVNYTRQDTT